MNAFCSRLLILEGKSLLSPKPSRNHKGYVIPPLSLKTIFQKDEESVCGTLEASVRAAAVSCPGKRAENGIRTLQTFRPSAIGRIMFSLHLDFHMTWSKPLKSELLKTNSCKSLEADKCDSKT